MNTELKPLTGGIIFSCIKRNRFKISAMRIVKAAYCILISGYILVASGCVGGRAVFTAPSVEKPVSYTDAVPASNGKFLSVSDRELVVVGSFETTVFKASTFLSYAPLWSRRKDLSEYLNAQLEEYGGDAIVHLKFETRPSYVGYITSLFGIGIILPGWNVTRLTGDVVKVNWKEVPKPGAAPPRSDAQ